MLDSEDARGLQRDGARSVVGKRSADAGGRSSPKISDYQRCCRSVNV